MELCGRQKVVQRKMVLLLVDLIERICWIWNDISDICTEVTVPVARPRR